VLQLKRGIAADAAVETIWVPALNGFRAEAESFERSIRLGPAHWNGATPEESLDILMTLEALLQSGRTQKPVELATRGDR
jgi:D-xylose 1-dehydrogenase (NADP+, D-xylono-1,5-lactone-forming)